MVIFSIICLVIIILSIQHLLNWLTRKVIKDINLSMLLVFGWVIGLFITYICFYNIIIWGQLLVK